MKKILCTLADKNNLDRAKQLFSSLYFHGQWSGDCMLITDSSLSDPKIEWFTKRGIYIHSGKLIMKKGPTQFHPTVYLKTLCFSYKMKKWDQVVFLDNDIIINSSIEDIRTSNKFSAISDFDLPLESQFFRPITLKQHIISFSIFKLFNPQSVTFNAGVFCFSTTIIKPWTETCLNLLALYLSKLALYCEQTVLNIFFYNNWTKLDKKYNYLLYPYEEKLTSKRFVSELEKKYPVLHFAGTKKPWDPSSAFYKHWKKYLDMSELISFQKKNHGKKKLILLS